MKGGAPLERGRKEGHEGPEEEKESGKENG